MIFTIERFRPFNSLRSQEWLISNFPSSLTRNITSHSMENLAFHTLLRWRMIILQILTTPLIHFSFKGWENVNFLSWDWKGYIGWLCKLANTYYLWFVIPICSLIGRRDILEPFWRKNGESNHVLSFCVFTLNVFPTLSDWFKVITFQMCRWGYVTQKQVIHFVYKIIHGK